MLLLDEITVDLDVVARLRLLDFFRDECEERGATILYATHIFDGAFWGAERRLRGAGVGPVGQNTSARSGAQSYFMPNVSFGALWRLGTQCALGAGGGGLGVAGGSLGQQLRDDREAGRCSHRGTLLGGLLPIP